MEEVIGKWLLDVAKYILTAILLSYFFSDLNDAPNLFIILLFFLATLLSGVVLIKRSYNGSTKCKTVDDRDNGPNLDNSRFRRYKKRRKETNADKALKGRNNPVIKTVNE